MNYFELKVRYAKNKGAVKRIDQIKGWHVGKEYPVGAQLVNCKRVIPVKAGMNFRNRLMSMKKSNVRLIPFFIGFGPIHENSG